MEKKFVKHVSEYVSHIESISARLITNPHFLFRGEGKADYSLVPSLYRKRDDKPTQFVYLKPNTERKIITEFMIEAAGMVNSLSVDDFSRWIEYAQHFGVPTRLLDWTSNPLVALYFACADQKKDDGRVYILHSSAYRQLVDIDDNNNMEGKLIKDIIKEMVIDQKEVIKYPVIYNPYHLDKRMVAQASHFMVWGNEQKPFDIILAELEQDAKVDVSTREQLMPGVIATCDEEAEILASVFVSGEHKTRILHELDVLGINHASLFPGLEGLGKSIRWRNDNRNRDYSRFDRVKT